MRFVWKSVGIGADRGEEEKGVNTISERSDCSSTQREKATEICVLIEWNKSKREKNVDNIEAVFDCRSSHLDGGNVFDKFLIASGRASQ